jgi:uncharacterized protein YbbC (DUF1343 family)/CubicO group peptidase (beta-lactamase class C family)
MKLFLSASSRLCAFALILSLLACATPQTHVISHPSFHEQKLAEMDATITLAISSNKLPGGVLWIEHNDAAYHRAYGQRSVDPVETMTEDTIFDAASLTKVVATTSAIMLLYERGQIDLDAPVSIYLAQFNGPKQRPITIRQLLTHTSGLRPDVSLSEPWSGYETGIRLALEEQPTTTPGTAFRYSDINFILLGEIVHRVSGKPLDEFTQKKIFKPLGMKNSTFNPPKSWVARVAPTTRDTEKDKENIIRGVVPTFRETNAYFRTIVHDPTARRMGGVAGHAGLFTTAGDLARFARMLLNRGELEGKRLFKPDTVALFTSVQSPPNLPRRGLGWDIDSPYAGPRGKYFAVGSYGHTGWTGGSIWIDPYSQSFVIFMSNRNHPTEAGNVLRLRYQLGTLVAEAIPDFNFTYVPNALEHEPERERTTIASRAVLNGIDVLKREKFARLKGLRVGLITNHTGRDRDRNPTIDLLHDAEGVQLKALFSPEHGIRGALDEKVSDSVDEKTGLPVYSLYGVRRAPEAEQLKDLDALVYDIQDIGCRFYTYTATMGNCLEAAAKAHLKFFVLDRLDPINGNTIEGPLAEKFSFTAYHNIPVRYGMTIGELARMFNAERDFKADLTVIPIQGWSRDFYFDQSELPWTNPSPNMRSLTEAILYPGIGLLETTAVSVGRGTDTPFEVVGAPYIDDIQLARELNAANLPGVRFVPVQFTPSASVFKDKPCKGVNIILTDRSAPVVDIGITIALTLQRLYPEEFNLPKFNNLLVHQPTLDAIRTGKSLAEIKQLWSGGLGNFIGRRSKFLLY